MPSALCPADRGDHAVMTSGRNESERGAGWTVPIVLVAAVALAVRLLHVVFTAHLNPLSGDLTLDAAIYDRWARALLAGGDIGPTRLMQAPLYPWFLAAVYRIAGPSLTAVRLAQALLGTASAILVTLVTKRLFRSGAASILAGAAAALYLPLIFYEGVLLPVTLIVFLNLLFVFLLLPAGRFPSRPRCLASGIVLGLSVIAKPVAILLWPFAALHLVLNARRGRSGPAFGSIAVLTAGLVVAVAPLTIRNAVLTGEFIPLTTGGGINFYIGNNPEANGFYAAPFYRGQPIGGTPEKQRAMMHKLASSEAGRDLSPSEVSNFWLRRGIEHNRAHPGTWTRLLWQKVLLFWNGYERANVESMSLHRRIPGVLRLPLLLFGLVAPFALTGVFLTRSRRRELWLLYGGILAYLFAALAFYVLARYRLPITVFLFPFAGACIVELVSFARRRSYGELILACAALLLLFYFTNMTVAVDTPFGVSKNLTRLAGAYIARGDTTAAVEAYREAARIFPQNGEARRALDALAPR